MPDDVKGGAALTEIGGAGLRVSSGRVREEFLRELQGPLAMRVYREMSRNDSIISAMLLCMDLILRGAKWSFQPNSEEPAHKEDADFAWGCLNDMNVSWSATFSEILSMLPFGWAWHEIVYKIRVGPDQTDPKRRSEHSDGKIGWRKWAIRGQETLLRWEFDPEGGVSAMVQRHPATGQEVTIPIQKALLFRVKSERGNPEGLSMLRGAYRSAFFKKRIEEIEGIGIERDLAGFPIAYIPPEYMQPDDDDVKRRGIRTSVEEMVKGIKRDTQEGAVLPAIFDANGNRLFELTLLSTGGSRQFDTDQIIRRYDIRIAMTLLADFLLIGHDKVGSFALVGTRSKLFNASLDAVLDAVAEVVNRHAVPRLFQLNAMPAPYPRLVHEPLQDVDVEAFARAINLLASGGMPLFPDAGVENRIREMLGLPTVTEVDTNLVDEDEGDVGDVDSEEEPEGEPGAGLAE